MRIAPRAAPRLAPRPARAPARRVGVLGFGAVGSGVIRRLLEGAAPGLELARVAVRDRTKRRPVRVPAPVLTEDALDVVRDASVDVVVEATGDRAARTWILEALRHGKDVVTANKAVVADHWLEIFREARGRGRRVGIRATFTGCHPIMTYLQRARGSAKKIERIRAVLNGTCNLVLDLVGEGRTFDEAVREAQRRGVAEADPSDDVGGTDTMYKVKILLHLMYGVPALKGEIPTEGIRPVEADDIAYARELGYEVKLVGAIDDDGGRVWARVHPALIPRDHFLAALKGVQNGIVIEDAYGEVAGWMGDGAGTNATAVAIMNDLLEPPPAEEFAPAPEAARRILALAPIEAIRAPWYLRLDLVDRAGVLARVASVLARQMISISAVIQKPARAGAPAETGRAGGRSATVPVVILTHAAEERAVRAAVARLRRLREVRGEARTIRIIES
jgi:homoserine dehydrogenase